ncbi:hypothetical protein WAF17_07885 [Bernardetia sp. ABR2-2B]|uniref:hypothetical protein n=1 Tax=Bernardetia sp. ABR2-2B TaxID=3127472 RepID=UPI0030D3EE0C
MRNSHVLADINVYGSKLLEHKNDLIKHTIKNIGLSSEKMDYSEESLYYIDNFLIGNEISKESTYSNLMGLLLYVGEVYTKKKGGYLKMKNISSNKWIVAVYNSDNSESDILIWVYGSVYSYAGNELPSITASYFAITANPFFK